MTETWHYTIRDGYRCTLTYDPDIGEANDRETINKKQRNYEENHDDNAVTVGRSGSQRTSRDFS